MSYLEDYQSAFDSILCTDNRAQIISYDEMIGHILSLCDSVKRNHRMMYFVGNGGSAGISIHMTSDFLKNGGIRTHSLHDPATLTCIANDFGYEVVFSKQLELIAAPFDLLVAISSSGKSPNVLNAVETARKKKCTVITLSGFQKENPLRKMGDINVYVPSMEYGIVESIHNMILQQVVDKIASRDGVGMRWEDK